MCMLEYTFWFHAGVFVIAHWCTGVCVYVCVCVCVAVAVCSRRLYVSECVRVYLYTGVCACARTHAGVCFFCVRVSVCICMSVCACSCAFSCGHLYACVCVFIRA